MDFNNPEVALDQLPQFSKIELNRVREDYPRITLTVILCFYFPGILLAGLFVFFNPAVNYFIFSSRGASITAALFLFLILLAAYTYFFARSFHFGIRQHDIILQAGVFWQKQTIQPLKRVQHVELTQGPVYKRYDLVKVKLFSAGTAMSSFAIPGMEYSQGEQLKEFILTYQTGDTGLFTASSSPREVIQRDE